MKMDDSEFVINSRSLIGEEDVDKVVEYDRGIREIERRKRENRRRYISGEMTREEVWEYTLYLEEEIRKMRERLRWHEECCECMRGVYADMGDAIQGAYVGRHNKDEEDEDEDEEDGWHERMSRMRVGAREQGEYSRREAERIRNRISRLEGYLYGSGYY
jgi:hypothetical protein